MVDRAKIEDQLATLDKLIPLVEKAERADVRFRRAELLVDHWYSTGDRHDLELAVSTYGEIKDESPDYPRLDEVLYFLADALDHLKREQDSVAALRELIQKFPTSKHVPRANWELAESSLRSNDRPKAAALFDRLLSDPELGLAARTRLVEIAIDARDRPALNRYCKPVPTLPASTDIQRQTLERLRDDCGR